LKKTAGDTRNKQQRLVKSRKKYLCGTANREVFLFRPVQWTESRGIKSHISEGSRKKKAK